MASVTGSVKPSPYPPAAASTSTMASGPYATDAIASSDSAARPVTAVSRCRAPLSGGSSAPGTASFSVVKVVMRDGLLHIGLRSASGPTLGMSALPGAFLAQLALPLTAP
ncbi:hypothetical protein STANM309S_06378 [Streptomyces tanashiensis]